MIDALKYLAAVGFGFVAIVIAGLLVLTIHGLIKEKRK